jgi:hypothetical protein
VYTSCGRPTKRLRTSCGHSTKRLDTSWVTQYSIYRTMLFYLQTIFNQHFPSHLHRKDNRLRTDYTLIYCSVGMVKNVYTFFSLFF